MRRIIASAAALAAIIATMPAAAQVTHIPAGSMPPGMTGSPPFSGAVLTGNTLYISGTTDNAPGTGKPPTTATEGAKLVLDNIRHTVETAGLTMDDLVWVQIFASNLKDYAAFNAVYRTYFKGPMPARAASWAARISR